MADPTPTTADVLVLCRDLLFASKIRGAAPGSTGATIRLLRDPAQLIGLDGRALIVDVGQDGATEAAGSWKAAHPASPVIGFVSHVDTDAIARAKLAGFDQVLSRGQFDATLPLLLRSLTQ